VAVVQYTNNTQNDTKEQYIEQHKNFGRVRAVPRLYILYPGICLTTEEKARIKPQSGYITGISKREKNMT